MLLATVARKPGMPTALDNGIRSPRKLLKSGVARLVAALRKL